MLGWTPPSRTGPAYQLHRPTGGLWVQVEFIASLSYGSGKNFPGLFSQSCGTPPCLLHPSLPAVARSSAPLQPRVHGHGRASPPLPPLKQWAGRRMGLWSKPSPAEHRGPHDSLACRVLDGLPCSIAALLEVAFISPGQVTPERQEACSLHQGQRSRSPQEAELCLRSGSSMVLSEHQGKLLSRSCNRPRHCPQGPAFPGLPSFLWGTSPLHTRESLAHTGSRGPLRSRALPGSVSSAGI